jgi:hypothetical protein
MNSYMSLQDTWTEAASLRQACPVVSSSCIPSGGNVKEGFCGGNYSGADAWTVGGNVTPANSRAVAQRVNQRIAALSVHNQPCGSQRGGCQSGCR